MRHQRGNTVLHIGGQRCGLLLQRPRFLFDFFFQSLFRRLNVNEGIHQQSVKRRFNLCFAVGLGIARACHVDQLCDSNGQEEWGITHNRVLGFEALDHWDLLVHHFLVVRQHRQQPGVALSMALPKFIDRILECALKRLDQRQRAGHLVEVGIDSCLRSQHMDIPFRIDLLEVAQGNDDFVNGFEAHQARFDNQKSQDGSQPRRCEQGGDPRLVHMFTFVAYRQASVPQAFRCDRAAGLCIRPSVCRETW